MLNRNSKYLDLERVATTVSESEKFDLDRILKNSDYKSRSEMLREYFDAVAYENEVRLVEENYIYIINLLMKKLKETNELLKNIEI